MRVRLGDYIKEYSARNKSEEDIPVYSVTNTQGFCRDYFGKEVASKDKSTYKIVPRGFFAYNPSRINVGSVDWQRVEDRVIVSPLYNVFSVSDELDQQYLYYYLKSNIGLQRIKAAATGSVRDNLKFSMLCDFPINLPSVSEQKAIVYNLDKTQSLIQHRQQELQMLDDLVKARFVEMFGDPKYNQNNLVKISDIGFLTSGGTPSRSCSDYFTGNIRWYSAGELNSLYLPDSIEHITNDAIEQSSAKLFEKGTLMIGMYDTAAFKMGILTESSSSNQACANLKPSKNYDVVWLYYLFDIMKPIFLNERQGVRQKNLSLSKIKDFVVPSASIERQNKFADFVKQIDKSKFAVQKALDKAQLLFDSLMQQYFG